MASAEVRRARGRAAGGGDHRARGQTFASRARLLRPRGAAPDGRPAGEARAARRTGQRRGARAARCGSSSACPTSTCCLPASGSATTTPASSRWRARSRPSGRDVVLVSKDLPMRVKASAMGLTAEEYRAELAVESGWTGMVELDVAGDVVDSLYDDEVIDLDEARELPCHTGVVLLGIARQRAGSGDARQAAPAGARRPRRLRPARSQRRAAHRDRPAARPRHRHPLAGRPGRHRQVGARAVRRARGRARTSAAPQGRRVPSAVRGRRSGARLPARHRGREDEPVGPGGVRHARRPSPTTRWSKRSSIAGCSRCCRSRTSADVRCTTRS